MPSLSSPAVRAAAGAVAALTLVAAAVAVPADAVPAGAVSYDGGPRASSADAATAPAPASASRDLPAASGVRAGIRDAHAALAPPARGHSFYFTRGIYTDYRRGRGWGGGAWATDYPKADLQFLTVLRRLTNLDAYYSEHAVAIDDPVLRRFPFLYMLEVGAMNLTPAEVKGLREYLLAGGFAFIDDFWGAQQWWNFEEQMRRVLPEYAIVDLPLTHPVFSSFYDIREILQVPNVRNAELGYRTTECGGCEVAVRGIFDEEGRLLVMINWNTDIGDAWEWAEQPFYPLKYSTFAYQIGANAIAYAMSH